MLWATHVPGIDPTRGRNLQQMSVLPADQGGEWSARVAHGVKIGQLFLIYFLFLQRIFINKIGGEMEGRECKNMKVRTCAVSLSRMHTRACHVYMCNTATLPI